MSRAFQKMNVCLNQINKFMNTNLFINTEWLNLAQMLMKNWSTIEEYNRKIKDEVTKHEKLSIKVQTFLKSHTNLNFTPFTNYGNQKKKFIYRLKDTPK